jgi:hypothetical protein
MEAVYELVLPDEGEKVVLADEAIDIGDAVAIDNEVWLIPARPSGRRRSVACASSAAAP